MIASPPPLTSWHRAGENDVDRCSVCNCPREPLGTDGAGQEHRQTGPDTWERRRKVVAETLGIGQQTVSDWFNPKDMHNTGSGNTHTPRLDARAAELIDILDEREMALGPFQHFQPNGG